MHQRTVTPAQRGRIAVASESGKAAEQPSDRDLTLQPGQRGADTVVDAVPERYMAAGLAGDIEPVWIGEAVTVTVPRKQRDEDKLAGRDLDAAVHRFGGDSRSSGAEGTVIAEEFLDGVGQERRV